MDILLSVTVVRCLWYMVIHVTCFDVVIVVGFVIVIVHNPAWESTVVHCRSYNPTGKVRHWGPVVMSHGSVAANFIIHISAILW